MRKFMVAIVCGFNLSCANKHKICKYDEYCHVTFTVKVFASPAPVILTILTFQTGKIAAYRPNVNTMLNIAVKVYTSGRN